MKARYLMNWWTQKPGWLRPFAILGYALGLILFLAVINTSGGDWSLWDNSTGRSVLDASNISITDVPKLIKGMDNE